MKAEHVILGAAIGGAVAWWWMSKKIPNAYALGQANPTTAFTSLTPAQHAQIDGPALASPPPVQTQLASITGTGALFRRR